MKTLSRSATLIIGLMYTHQFLIGQTGNYFAGYQAGLGNTGINNTFVGYQSNSSANSGSYNSSFGYRAGRSNTSGDFNTYIGTYAGSSTLVGEGNTAVGYFAGAYNSNGDNNALFGSMSGAYNEAGTNNAFFGARTGLQSNGNNNVFIGFEAGYYNDATENSFVGYSAGRKNTDGFWNAFFGGNTGTNNTSGYRNTFIGTRSGIANTSGYHNAFVGTESGMLTTTGRENTFIGRAAGRNNTTGNFNTAIGNYAQPASSNLSYTTAIGHKAYVKVSNAVVIGSINGENSANVTTKVGIGTSSPAYLLHVNGVAAKPGGGSWTVASDKRLKKDIRPFNEGLKELLQVNPVWFRYNGKAGMPTERQYVGVIAQEMQKVAPHTISEFTYEDGEGHNEKYLDYDANALNYMLVNAVKELSAEVKQLKEEIAALKKGTPLPDAQYGAARLWQNAPNPYASSTVIRYFVPETAGHAQIVVFSVTGQEVYTRELSLRGESEIEISNSILAVGSYVYQLVVDGKVVDNKKMIVTK